MTTDSTDTTKRAETAGYADALGEYARKMSTNLQTLQNDINTEISSTVKQINAYAEQLAALTNMETRQMTFVTREREYWMSCHSLQMLK